MKNQKLVGEAALVDDLHELFLYSTTTTAAAAAATTTTTRI